MPISAATVWEVRTTGSDTSGGGFVAGASGTDRSQQNSAQVVIDNSTITCTTPAANSNTLTFVSGYTPSAADVGNIVQITGGTNTNTGFFQITAQTSTTWTVSGNFVGLSTAGGAASAITGNMGGCLATPGKALSGMAGGNTLNIKASGTYTLTAAIPVTQVAAFPAITTIQGYGTVIGDGTRPTITCATNSVNLFELTGAGGIVFRSLKLTHTAVTRGAAFAGITTASTFVTIDDCLMDGCSYGVSAGSREFGNLLLLRSTIQNCTSGGVLNSSSGSVHRVIDSFIYNNAGAGYDNSASSVTVFFINSVFAKNTKGIYDTGTVRTVEFLISGCTIAGNSSDGIRSDESTGIFYLSLAGNTIYGNGGWGVNAPSGRTQTRVHRTNAYGSNTPSNYTSTVPAGSGEITLSADPFTASASGDYSPNSTSGGGLALRAAFGPAFPGGLTTGYADVGAAQHQDTGGASGIPNVARIIQNIGTY